LKLVDKCKKKNLIVCLQTGTGKTYIAVMLIKELINSILVPFDQGGKRTIFLVNTVPLVLQQAEVIRRHTDLKVGDYFGEKKINNRIIDSSDKKMWENELNTKNVLVMSAQILVEMLSHNYISN
jgi:endoribonuclease Dicer